MRRVSKVHDGDTALVPGLHFDIAARHGNQRSVMRYAVLRITLRSRQLVIVLESQFFIVETEDRVRAPLVRVVRTAARAQAPTPFIGKYDFASIIGERS